MEPRGRGESRLAKRAVDDEHLLIAMESAPDASIGDLAAAIGKSRSSVVTALGRLRDAGLAETRERKWRLVEDPEPKVSAPKWVAPLKATDRAAHAHLTAS
jgi:DNA-binding transcriptional ArsR family regulator